MSTGIVETQRTDLCKEWKDGHECFDCHAPFSPLKRKHHCRNCGNVFCARCTNFRIINDAGKPNRACDACYAQHINPALEEDSVTENEALHSMFTSLGGQDWIHAAGWNHRVDDIVITSKFGVTTNEEGHVTMVVLNKNRLNGLLPDSIRHLKHLTKICLTSNDIFGPMCKAIGNLCHLVCLQLSDNKLTGRIPGFLGSCKSLQRLDLSINLFYGSIPDDICSLTNLMWLHLNNNDISGKLPDHIEKLVNLKSLMLNNNSMSIIKCEIIEKLPADCTLVLDDPSACLMS